jgi:hypothetical protein
VAIGALPFALLATMPIRATVRPTRVLDYRTSPTMAKTTTITTVIISQQSLNENILPMTPKTAAHNRIVTAAATIVPARVFPARLATVNSLAISKIDRKDYVQFVGRAMPDGGHWYPYGIPERDGCHACFLRQTASPRQARAPNTSFARRSSSIPASSRSSAVVIFMLSSESSTTSTGSPSRSTSIASSVPMKPSSMAFL